MKVKKITQSPNKEHTYDIMVPEVHSYGIRTKTKNIVSHNSSVCSNSTNGIEPVRSLMTYKGSKKGQVPFLVPNVSSHGEYYTLAFEQKDNIGYLNIAAVIQKFTDMAMSINVYYNPKNYPDKKVPYQVMLKEMLYHNKLGGKTMYYSNTEDGNKHFEEKKACSGDSCTL